MNNNFKRETILGMRVEDLAETSSNPKIIVPSITV